MTSLADILRALHERRLQVGMHSEEGKSLTEQMARVLVSGRPEEEITDWAKRAAGERED